MGWFTPDNIELDGTIWYIVNEYADEDGWFHTKTKLSKFLFLVKQETDYCNHIEWRESLDYGPVSKNLEKAIEQLETEEAIYVREQMSQNGTIAKSSYKARKQNEYEEKLTTEQKEAIDNAIQDYQNISNLMLIEQLQNEYPEYDKRIR